MVHSLPADRHPRGHRTARVEQWAGELSGKFVVDRTELCRNLKRCFGRDVVAQKGAPIFFFFYPSASCTGTMTSSRTFRTCRAPITYPWLFAGPSAPAPRIKSLPGLVDCVPCTAPYTFRVCRQLETFSLISRVSPILKC